MIVQILGVRIWAGSGWVTFLFALGIDREHSVVFSWGDHFARRLSSHAKHFGREGWKTGLSWDYLAVDQLFVAMRQTTVKRSGLR